MQRSLISNTVLLACAFVPFAAHANPADDSCASSPTKDCLPAPPGLPDNVPDLDILKTPLSPASAAVGASPVDIERPTTPTGAAASLASGIVHGLLVPGTNVAIEIAPYWLVPHRLLSADAVENSPALAFVRDFSLSYAAATGPDPTQPMNAPMMTNAGLMALGARTTIAPGWRSKEAEQCLVLVRDFMKADVEGRGKEKDEFVKKWETEHPVPALVPVEPEPADTFQQRNKEVNGPVLVQRKKRHAQLDADLAAWLAAWEGLHPTAADVEACAPIMRHRVGLLASAAGSVLLSAPGGDFSKFRQTGAVGELVWLTAGWSGSFGGGGPSSSGVWDYSLLAATRWRHQAPVADSTASTSALDLGLRVVFAWSKLGFSAQGMRLGEGANGFGTPRSIQGGVALDYHLKTGFWLTVTAGSADLGHIDSFNAATALIHLQYNASPDRMIGVDTTSMQAAASPSGGAPK